MESIISHQPIRSISLPTRTHPSSQRVESLLNHLKQHHSSSSSHHHHHHVCLDGDTIQGDLIVLVEFYNTMEELLQSPQTKQALMNYQKGELVDHALSSSITLLDACVVSRDLLLNLKEHVQSLQSAIRRTIRRGDSSSIAKCVCEYERFRKKGKKVISKQLEAMKRIDNCSSQFGKQDQCVTFLASVLRDASSVTVSIFRSLLLFLSKLQILSYQRQFCSSRIQLFERQNPKRESYLISKIKSTRSLFSSSEKEHEIIKNNEVEDLNGDSKVEVEGALRMMETLGVSIDGLEAALDCIFRCLVQNRVSFLNILTHH
ncbi:hypothetical protein PIB30_024308 [Stylosanthes scabra]|uniref:DUF241 domain protein n=1 Tax=Stylosanthes scabra TaxID=79078 RepID=A0ABU6X7A3_9FABA|nr:hypothetical protein [Stylosanthes scabra]